MRNTFGIGGVLLAAAAAGCGDGTDSVPQSLPEGRAGVTVVRMTDEMRFEPEHLSIQVGDTVVWVNDGRLPHTSTDTPGRAAVPAHTILPPGADAWDSGIMESGATYTRAFTVPGDYTYLCTLHEATGMVGTITVTEP